MHVWLSTAQESNVTSSNMAAESRDDETPAATSGDERASDSSLCSVRLGASWSRPELGLAHGGGCIHRHEY